jgi:hypothetical protein
MAGDLSKGKGANPKAAPLSGLMLIHAQEVKKIRALQGG